MRETETIAVNHPQDALPSQPSQDTEPPAPVARSSPTRLAFRTMAIIFLLFITVGATTQILNTAAGIWFTELFVFLGVAWVRVRLSGRDPARYAGLTSPHWRSAAYGFAFGVVNFFALVIPIQSLAQSIAPASWREHWDVTNLFRNQTPLELGVIILGVVVAAPFCEEFVFRGVLQRGLMPPALSSRGAVALTAIVFSAFHLDPVGFPARLELGLVFGLLYFNGTPPAEDAPPSWSAILSVSLLGTIATLGLVALVRKDPSILPRHPPIGPETESRPVSLRLAARPWIIAALSMVLFLALADRRGLVLGWYDLSYHLPPLGKSANERQKVERDKLEALRKDARAGKVPLESYRALREELSRESRRSERDSG